MLEDYRAKLEETKAKVEKGESQADLILHQFMYECLEITGNRHDFVDMDEAYELYCAYADVPMSKRWFPINITHAGERKLDHNYEKTRLLCCKFKPNIIRSR